MRYCWYYLHIEKKARMSEDESLFSAQRSIVLFIDSEVYYVYLKLIFPKFI